MRIRPLAKLVVFVAAMLPTVCLADDPPKVVDVVNQVEGATTILAIVDHGAQVKKGDILFELDSAALKDKLTNQQIVLAQAKAEVENAKKTLEVVTITSQETREGVDEEIKTTENDVKISELDVKIAQAAVEGEKAKLSTNGDETNYNKAKNQLARAQTDLNKNKGKLKSFKDIIGPKRKQEADLNVGTAQTEVKTVEAIYLLEIGKADKIKKMIGFCTVKAPREGQVYYANPNPPRADGYVIEEGATVREKQVVIRIVGE